jgi:hypothetical protein
LVLAAALKSLSAGLHDDVRAATAVHFYLGSGSGARQRGVARRPVKRSTSNVSLRLRPLAFTLPLILPTSAFRSRGLLPVQQDALSAAAKPRHYELIDTGN